jgi:ATP-binding cassette subfamily F protein 3
MLVWQLPNLLLLDEPTNHLDLTTREALSMALNEFEGTVMLVSHDRALLREVCDEFWLVTEGAVKPFDGDLDDYQRWLLDQSREASRGQAKEDKAKRKRDAAGSVATDSRSASPKSAPAKTAPAAVPATPSAARGNDRKSAATARQQKSDDLKPLRKELNSVDNRLGVLMSDRETAEASIATADIAPAARADIGKRLKQIGDEIDMLEARWLELSTRLDAMTAQPAE